MWGSEVSLGAGWSMEGGGSLLVITPSTRARVPWEAVDPHTLDSFPGGLSAGQTRAQFVPPRSITSLVSLAICSETCESIFHNNLKLKIAS